MTVEEDLTLDNTVTESYAARAGLTNWSDLRGVTNLPGFSLPPLVTTTTAIPQDDEEEILENPEILLSSGEAAEPKLSTQIKGPKPEQKSPEQKWASGNVARVEPQVRKED